MKKRFLILMIAVLGLSACSAQSNSQKSNLRILYVGGSIESSRTLFTTPDPEKIKASAESRMKAFEKFLKDYFTNVTVIHADNYKQEMSNDYDVTVMDGTPKQILPSILDRERELFLKPGYLTEDFDRPILAIGEICEVIGSRIGLKNDWYCLCLDADAHHWRAEHPIFKGPFKVQMTVVEKPTPEAAFLAPYYHDGPIPEKIPMWSVQTKGYTTEPGFRVGMVSRPWGYEDSPEAEYISSGVCAKTLDAVAIGRHGNFFQWGFAASPAYMTEEAKPVLANAIVYISKFAGQTPIARKYNERLATREYVKALKYTNRREAYEEKLANDAKLAQQIVEARKELQERLDKGEKVDPMAFAIAPPKSNQSFEEYMKESAKGELFELFGTDEKAIGRYLDENYDYFYGGEGTFTLQLDKDVKSLGIPNSDKRLLDAAIKLLEEGKDTEKAKRILARYTLVDFPDAKGWRNWYKTNKDRLFWTESGGWLFLINSREPGVNDYRMHEAHQALRRLQPGKTNDNNPVAMVTDVVPLQEGGYMLYVKVNIHPGYHIYGNVAVSDAFTPTVVTVELPSGYNAVGGVNYPMAKYYNSSGTTIYTGEVVFSQKISGPRRGELKCSISYQCCDAHICFPPDTETFMIKLP